MNLLPIETAPKDGTWILLFGPSAFNPYPVRCETCCWNDGFVEWITYSGKWFDKPESRKPTHWCPIPSLPQDVVLPEKTVAKKGGCYYCPECGHKFWDAKTDSGEFEPFPFACQYCQ